MLEQFINSTIVYFKKIEPMNTYVQKMPTGVKYPCMLVNKVDVKPRPLNSYMFMNRVTVYVRIFGKNEIETKNKAVNIIQQTMEDLGKIPVLNEDGSPSQRFIRIEEFDMIDISVDENEVYCNEIVFSFETSHKVNVNEFAKIANVHSRTQ